MCGVIMWAGGRGVTTSLTRWFCYVGLGSIRGFLDPVVLCSKTRLYVSKIPRSSFSSSDGRIGPGRSGGRLRTHHALMNRLRSHSSDGMFHTFSRPKVIFAPTITRIFPCMSWLASLTVSVTYLRSVSPLSLFSLFLQRDVDSPEDLCRRCVLTNV